MSGKIYQGSRLVAQTNDAPLGFEDKGIELEVFAIMKVILLLLMSVLLTSQLLIKSSRFSN